MDVNPRHEDPYLARSPVRDTRLMPTPAEYEEGLQRASEDLGLLAHKGIDYALQAAWDVLRAYDDDEIWDE